MKWVKIFNSLPEAEKVFERRNPVRLIIGEKRFCLILFQGQYYATDNLCPHQRASLDEGTINYLGEIICPLHAYRYNLKTGRECQQRTNDLITYPVKHDESGLYIFI